MRGAARCDRGGALRAPGRVGGVGQPVGVSQKRMGASGSRVGRPEGDGRRRGWRGLRGRAGRRGG